MKKVCQRIKMEKTKQGDKPMFVHTHTHTHVSVAEKMNRPRAILDRCLLISGQFCILNLN